MSASIWNPSSPAPVGLVSVADLANTADATKGDFLIGVKSVLAGATARTQHDKNSDLISIKDFGAIGDGVTDDTAAIQAALNASKYVLVPESQFLFTQLTMPDDTQLIGVGALSILKTVSNLTSIVSTGTVGTRKKNIVIRSLQILRTGGDGHHAKLIFVDNPIFEDVLFTGGRSSTGVPVTSGGYASYLLLWGTRNANTVRCRFEGNASMSMDSSDGTSTGTWGEDNRVIDCYMTGAAQGFEANNQNNFRYKNTVSKANINSLYACGFLVYGGSSGGVYESCVSSGHTRDGYYVEGGAVYLGQDITYENCAGYDNGEAGLYAAGNFKGINVVGGLYNLNRAVFNDGTGYTGLGLRFDGSSEVSVSGATVRNNASHGIVYYANPFYFTCENNAIRDNAGWGIVLNGTPQAVKIKNNRFRSNATGDVQGFTFAANNEWDGAPWQAYTPTWISSGGATSVGNGVLSGKYFRSGNVVNMEILLDWGSTTTSAAGTWDFGLPIAQTALAGPQSTGGVYMLDASVAGAIGSSYIVPGSGVVRINCANGILAGPGNPFVWATGDRLMFSLIYKIA